MQGFKSLNIVRFGCYNLPEHVDGDSISLKRKGTR